MAPRLRGLFIKFRGLEFSGLNIGVQGFYGLGFSGLGVQGLGVKRFRVSDLLKIYVKRRGLWWLLLRRTVGLKLRALRASHPGLIG